MRDGWMVFILFILVMATGFLLGITVAYKDRDMLSKKELERSGYAVHVYRHTVDGVSTNWIEVLRKDGRTL